MRRKKIIALFMGLMIAFATTGTFLACNGNAGTGGSSSESSSSTDSGSDLNVIEYKITFNSLGGSFVESQNVKSGAKATEPESPTRDGYDFVEWQLNGKTYDFDTRVTGNIILTAKWKPTEPTKYTVSFVSEEAAEPFIIVEVTDGKKVSKPSEEPEKSDYFFEYWTLNGEEYDFTTPITGNLTLVAKWAVGYTVTFDTVEGAAVESAFVKEGTAVTAPTAPTKAGYIFEYWTLNGEEYDFTTPITGNLTLVAKWAVGYTVTFDTLEGTAVESAFVKKGTTVTEPTKPTQAGYDFVEWQLNGEKYDFSTPVTGDITLTATWTPSAISSDQIGIRINGWNMSSNANYFQMSTGTNGEIIITANKFQANATYAPALIFKNIHSKEYYQSLIEDGYTRYTFNLAIEGDVSDLYVCGKALSTFPETDGVYAIEIKLAYLVQYYETIHTIATSGDQVGQAGSLAAKFITWKSPENDWSSVRSYVFTFSNMELKETEPMLEISFAEGSKDTIKAGETTTLTVETNMAGEIEWHSSNETIATVVNGVVTGLKGGEVTITAKLGELTASKTITIEEVITYNNQIGIRINGNDVTSNANYFQMSTGTNGEIIITANKFQADATYAPALIFKNLQEKAAYEALIAQGYDRLVFNLAIEGDVSDLYVCGKALSAFPETDGVYAIEIKLAYLVQYYDTIHTIATSDKQVGQAGSLAAKFIAWKSPENDWSSVRSYVFTFSNMELKETEPTPIEYKVSFDSLGGSLVESQTVKSGEKATAPATPTFDGYDFIEWQLNGEKYDFSTPVTGDITLTATWTPSAISSNQIGIRINGWNMSSNADYLSFATGNNGETIVTAKFQANATYAPALILRNIHSKEYYQTLIANGYVNLTFTLAVDGDETDLYVFGKKLTDFAKNTDGSYEVVIAINHFVQYYETINTIATSGDQVGQGTSLAAKFIAWKSPENDWSSVRSYVFTISNSEYKKA